MYLQLAQLMTLLASQVGSFSWALDPDTPSLKAEALVYTFATPGNAHT